ncbi:MAG: Ig-like domain-containing protein [Thermoguttaceae bacterium]
MKRRTLFAIITAGALCGFASQVVRGQDIESAPPVVVKTVPEAGTKKVPPGDYVIKVTFSKKMQDRSWSWSTAWADSTPKTVGAPRYEADRKTCVLKVKLEANKTYGYWLNSQNFQNFKDAQGRPAIPYLLVFKTGEKAAAQEPESAPATPETATE